MILDNILHHIQKKAESCMYPVRSSAGNESRGSKTARRLTATTSVIIADTATDFSIKNWPEYNLPCKDIVII